jgi:hypothetical protein
MNFLNRMKELYIYFVYVSNKVITFQKKIKRIKTLTSERHYYYFYFL